LYFRGRLTKSLENVHIFALKMMIWPSSRFGLAKADVNEKNKSFKNDYFLITFLEHFNLCDASHHLQFSCKIHCNFLIQSVFFYESEMAAKLNAFSISLAFFWQTRPFLKDANFHWCKMVHEFWTPNSKCQRTSRKFIAIHSQNS
jgi:hypothetical protein